MIEHVSVSQDILQYVRENSLRDLKVLQDLREVTDKLPERKMQIMPEQGQFLSLLVKLMRAKKTLEIGVFTGYSALCTALSLPSDGLLTACDSNEEWMAIAQEYWKRAGVEDRIDVRIGDAKETLDILLNQMGPGSYDFVFIDADKENYNNYYERALKLIRQGGLIVFDNTLWSGRVANQDISDPETDSLRKINSKLLNDERVEISMLPFADGLTLVLKK